MLLAAIDTEDERVLLSYHGAEESATPDVEVQAPRITEPEVNAELHVALVASIMVGAPG